MTDSRRRFIICGPACAGKSTLARLISKKTGVPHIELDAIFWRPGWVELPVDEFRSEVSTALEKYPDGWVCDGNYSRVRDLTLPQADTFIWLRPFFRVAFWRLLKRTVHRCLDNTSLWGTNHESWRKAFFSLDSLLLYQITHWRRYNRKILEDLDRIPHRAEVVELRSQKEVDGYLAGLMED